MLATLQSIGSDRLAAIGRSAGISNRLDRLEEPIGRSAGIFNRLEEPIGRSAVADPIVDFPTPIGRPRSQKTSSSQKRLHRNSGQNRPIERSTALTGTIFVTLSVFVSRGNFRAIFWQLLTDLLLARSTFNARSGAVRAGSTSNAIYF